MFKERLTINFSLSKFIAPEMVIHAAKETNMVFVNNVDDTGSNLNYYELAYYEQLALLNFIFKIRYGMSATYHPE